jgi:hypothetical protein
MAILEGDSRPEVSGCVTVGGGGFWMIFRILDFCRYIVFSVEIRVFILKNTKS